MAWITKELKHKGLYLNAALFVPETKPGEKYPLVLFLHGAGERGDDLTLVGTAVAYHRLLDLHGGILSQT